MPQGSKYDLETRTLCFAMEVRKFVKQLPYNVWNTEDIRQLVRASGSVGANYIEGNEALGDKDMKMKFRICRKEAKESNFWLSLVDTNQNRELEKQRISLKEEANQLRLIFSSILNKLS